MLVLGSSRPSHDATTALDKTLQAFGYGNDAFAVATTMPLDPSVEGGDIPLDPQALFLLVEGLDPLLIVCTDETAIETMSQAYRTTFKRNSAERVFGRPAVMFEDLDGLMASEAGKQQAWRLLKSLPRR